MKIGDKFFTIAYTSNTRVIEVEIIGIENINDTVYIHFQNVENIIDKWFLPIEIVEEWHFKTREQAHQELEKIKIKTIIYWKEKI